MQTGEIYHITTKSIASYVILNNEAEFLRMKDLIQYYQVDKPAVKFSYFLAHAQEKKQTMNEIKHIKEQEKLVKIIAYCFMPTHIHLILQQLKEMGISDYMRRILNSYTKYFNTKHNRKGPLWEGRFRRPKVETDEQLMHLTRYVHLNPSTAFLVEKPGVWLFSSYKEYIVEMENKDKICEFKEFLDIKPNEYEKFVNDQIAYQRELAIIKKLVE